MKIYGESDADSVRYCARARLLRAYSCARDFVRARSHGQGREEARKTPGYSPLSVMRRFLRESDSIVDTQTLGSSFDGAAALFGRL